MDFICTSALNDWRSLNGMITSLTEEQIEEMIDYECNNRKRSTVVVRLHQRLTSLRSNRERMVLMKKLIL